MGNLFSVRRNFNTHDEENYVRFGKAIVGIGTSILQQVLETYIPSFKIASIVRSNSNLRLNQKQILLVNQAGVVGYKDFDITLCYTLLRNVFVPNKPCFPIPTRGWGNQPLATDVTLSDDVERLRILRNEMFCHLPYPAIPIIQFREIWKQLREICDRVRTRFPNGKDFSRELRILDICNVTRVQWNSLVELVDKCREYEKAMEDHSNRLDAMESDFRVTSAEIDTLDNEVQRHSVAIAFLNDGFQRHNVQIIDHTRQLRSLDMQVQNQQADMLDIKEIIKTDITKLEPDIGNLRKKLVKIYKEQAGTQKLDIFQKGCEEDVPLELAFASLYIHGNMIDLYKSRRYTFKKIISPNPLLGRRWEETDPYTCNIFELDGIISRNIYVLGDEGFGKTSLCKWLFQKWCIFQHRDENGTIDMIDNWEKVMCEFDFVFPLQFRNVNPNLISVIDMIIESVSERGDELSTEINKVLSSEEYRCLIIMDGLDEWNPSEGAKKQLHCKRMPNIRVSKRTSCFITMKRCLFQTISNVIRKNDREVKILGRFSDFQRIINYELLNRFGLKEDSLRYTNLSDKIKNNLNSIEEAMKNPLLAALCVHIWVEGKNINNSMTSFYAVMIDMLIEIALQKRDVQIEYDKKLDYNLPTIFTGTVHIEKCFPILLKLRQIAFQHNPICKTIFANELPENELSSYEINCAIKLGLVIQTHDPRSEDTIVRFLNKSIEDFVIAINIVTQSEASDAFCKFISTVTVDDIEKLSCIIMLICGLRPSLGSIISQHVGNVIDSDEYICNYRESCTLVQCFNVERMFLSHISWYRELQNGQRKSPEAFLFQHVWIIYNRDSDTETLRLAKDILKDDNVEIRSLLLYHVPTDRGITDTELNDFLCSKQRTRSLIRLHIDCSIDQARTLKTISIPTLRVLHLSNINPDNSANEDIACSPLVNALTELQTLQIISMSIGDGELCLSGDMKELKTIKLESVTFSTVGWEKFLTSLRLIRHNFNVCISRSRVDENMNRDIRSSIDFEAKCLKNSTHLYFSRIWRETERYPFYQHSFDS